MAMIGRYLVFCWSSPHGGADDFVGSVDSYADIQRLLPETGHEDRANVLDSHTGLTVEFYASHVATLAWREHAPEGDAVGTNTDPPWSAPAGEYWRSVGI